MTKKERENLQNLLEGVNLRYESKFDTDIIDLKTQELPDPLPDLTIIFGIKTRDIIALKHSVEGRPIFPKVKEFWDNNDAKLKVWEGLKSFLDTTAPKVRRILKREELNQILNDGLLETLNKMVDNGLIINTQNRMIRIVDNPNSLNEFSKEEFIIALSALLMFNARQIDVFSKESIPSIS